MTPGYNTYAIRLADGYVVGNDQHLYTLKSSLLNAPIPNDPPPLPTALDTDGDGTDETVYVSSLEGKVRQYTLTAQGVTAPTLAAFQTGVTKDVFNANTVIGTCASGVACQPIGVSPTIVLNGNGDFDVLVATGGADWARQTTDKGDLTATKNQSYVTGFDATTYTNFPTSPFKLGGIQPPASAAGGSSPGTTNLVPLSLRAYAQLTVAGSDLYANVTSISIGSMQQLLLPLMTPGTYGNVAALEQHQLDDADLLRLDPDGGDAVRRRRRLGARDQQQLRQRRRALRRRRDLEHPPDADQLVDEPAQRRRRDQPVQQQPAVHHRVVVRHRQLRPGAHASTRPASRSSSSWWWSPSWASSPRWPAACIRAACAARAAPAFARSMMATLLDARHLALHARADRARHRLERGRRS